MVSPSSTWRTVSHALRNVYSCITSPTTTGTITPSTLLRVTIETIIASAPKASVGNSTVAQLAATRPSAVDAGRRAPPTSTSGSLPTVMTPASVALAATVTTATVVNVNTAAGLPQNTAVRPTERVRMVLSVPCWSSDEKTSPASSAAISGSTHCEAYTRIASGVA